MKTKIKNTPIRLRIATLAIVAVILMLILSVVGFITASVIGKIVVCITFAIGAVVGVIATSLISHSILEQIKEVNRIMENVAAGNLNVSVSKEYYTAEEFGNLFVCIDSTLERLHTYIAYIDELSVSLDKIADGYMKIELNQEYSGEFAVLKAALTKISKSLSDTVTTFLKLSKK